MVFQKFQKTALQLDIDKCEFYVQKIKYLNFIITTKNIKMDQEIIASIFDWLKFENLKDVKSFLNFGSFYKRFFIKIQNTQFFKRIG